ncbi:hypothetical protein GGS23DRAFT_569294 [Durotheca rogersii]|uniref:uncharacterized protein n=1 Tax=Durotheca rogersii TaxID=419775 RepID=UPI00221F1127|nr:uncharacterized protein GGS23DRAFT_569294 [Durotheca rogersii]KAI5862755.1 hypothetical protein GGS23DRAFT_569294 [Durotheca rogersii]
MYAQLQTTCTAPRHLIRPGRRRGNQMPPVSPSLSLSPLPLFLFSPLPAFPLPFSLSLSLSYYRVFFCCVFFPVSLLFSFSLALGLGTQVVVYYLRQYNREARGVSAPIGQSSF